MSSHYALALVVIASMVAVSCANKDWQNGNYSGWGFNPGPYPGYPRVNKTRGPSKIIVGGSDWHFGFNYTEWALKNSPFYIKDTLVFKYAPPNATTRPHSVYMFRDLWSFMNCDLKRARMVGSPNQGGGEGFAFKLTKWQPYYFACGEHDGLHCKDGMMKFFVFPMMRGWNY